ncbi:MAG: exodeoxyribonuclease III [Desulfovibrio sp.]|nr:exodeoxyribonuclease III [Desulfovibrio sp.]
MALKLLSWNVNGLRAVSAKPDWRWFTESDADCIALQETKALPSQLADSLTKPAGWHAYFCSSTVKKGYSGVAVFSRQEPIKVTQELPWPEQQGEGRLLHLEFAHWHLMNGYFPNGGAAIVDEKGHPTGQFNRLPYKMAFFEAFLRYAEEARKSKPVVVCGDFNIAHKPCDLARPKENEKNTGFLPEERAFLDRMLAQGYLDTFRLRHPEAKDAYSWWSYKTRARAKNIGWRIDYFFVSSELADAVEDAWIEDQVMGSDHCPVGLRLKISD